jgi:hypothetical protein
MEKNVYSSNLDYPLYWKEYKYQCFLATYLGTSEKLQHGDNFLNFHILHNIYLWKELFSEIHSSEKACHLLYMVSEH